MSAADIFLQLFGEAPEAIAQAPGRINLIGEHIDYNGGTVLPAAIERCVNVALGDNTLGRHRIQSAKFDSAIERPINDAPNGHWSDYAVGGLAKAEEFGWISGGVNLAIESDVPDGAGLSSSAALLTAILRAAAKFAGVAADPVEIARAAQAVENDYIGVPCGIMDQMAVGLATTRQALALNTAEETFHLVPMPEDWEFVIIHSGVHRALSDGRYKTRFEECAEAARALGGQYLCELDADQVRRIETLPPNLAGRARHAHSEQARTLEAIEAMKAGDAARFGELMNESHMSYAEDFEASTPEIDSLVKDARALGALGSRLTGGGFGGCTVHLLVETDVETWTKNLLQKHASAWRVW